MSWRAASKMFCEIWPIIQANIVDRDQRIEFTACVLNHLVQGDMDSYDVEDVHPEVRAALKLAGIEIDEPERYKDEDL